MHIVAYEPEPRNIISQFTINEYLKQKWKWAGHIARLRDNRWTKRCTVWQPREGRGREDDQAEDGKMT